MKNVSAKITSVLMACTILYALPFQSTAASKKKKLPNHLRSIVVFYNVEKGDDGIEHATPVGTGFAANYKGKLCAISNLNMMFQTLTPIPKSIDAKPLPVKKILIPKDRRDIAVFVLDTDKLGENDVVPLEIDDHLTSNVNIDDKVLSYGCRSDWATVTYSKGKITAIGPERVEIKGTMAYNMNGGPVIAESTGKVVGVISAPPKGEKKTRSCVATRVDSAYEFVNFKKSEFEDDTKTLADANALLARIKVQCVKYKQAIATLMKTVQDGYGTNHKKISQFARMYYNDLAIVKRKLASGKDGSNKFHLQYFKAKYQSILDAVKKELKQFIALKPSIDKLNEANAQAAEKNTIKKPEKIDF